MSRNCNKDWNCSKSNECDYHKDCCECRRDCCDYYKDCAKCEERHPCPKPVILACEEQQNIIFPTNCEVNDKLVATLEIDTTCLCSHLFKLDFSANMIYESDYDCDSEVQAEIDFELYKCCNGNEDFIGTWRYKREFESFSASSHTHNIEAGLFDTFNFSYCKFVKCAGCCTYKLYASTNDLRDVEKLNMNNIYISAIAQSV